MLLFCSLVPSFSMLQNWEEPKDEVNYFVITTVKKNLFIHNMIALVRVWRCVSIAFTLQVAVYMLVCMESSATASCLVQAWWNYAISVLCCSKVAKHLNNIWERRVVADYLQGDWNLEVTWSIAFTSWSMKAVLWVCSRLEWGYFTSVMVCPLLRTSCR